VTAKGVIPFRGSGKILDIGVGGGSYLYRLKQLGWNTFGVEPSAIGWHRARSLGLNVFHGPLEDAAFPDKFFDVIRLSNVLEHLPNPRATFKEIHRILKPDGLVYVTVPNTDGLGFRLFRENWYAIDVPRHVISYAPKTLQTLAEITGFKIQTQQSSGGPFNFVRSVGYLLEDDGNRYPNWLRNIDWVHSKLIRRALKPFFLLLDLAGYGDFMHVTLTQEGRFRARDFSIGNSFATTDKRRVGAGSQSCTSESCPACGQLDGQHSQSQDRAPMQLRR
jgi:SAM-dependent methyltransferase